MAKRRALSTTERVPAHTRYEIIAYANGQAPIYYEEFGSYQGEWLMLARDEAGFSLYKGSYGSCSGCDSYEADIPTYDDSGVSMEKAREFAKDYVPFLVVPELTMRNLCDARTLGEVLPANIREDYGDFPSHDALAAQFMLAACVDRGWPIHLEDISAARNQELRARALKAFGYDRWIKEVGAKVLDRLGDDELVQAGDEFFVHVKDASTERRYLLRVPPRDAARNPMTRVRQAVAWTFGLTEATYNPTRET